MELKNKILTQSYNQIIEELGHPTDWYEEQSLKDPYYNLLLAYMYDQGIQVIESHTKAKEYLMMAHKHQIVEALIPLGYYHLFWKEDQQAIHYFKQASKAGILLGTVEWFKLLNDKDDEFDYLAHQLLKQNEIPIQNYLGEFYFKQQTPESITKAIDYFKQGKELKQLDASLNLGLCLIQGIGVEQDLKQGKEAMMFAYQGGLRIALEVCIEALEKQGKASEGFALLHQLIDEKDDYARFILVKKLTDGKTFGMGLVQAFYHASKIKNKKEVHPLYVKLRQKTMFQTGFLIVSVSLLIYLLINAN